MVMTPSTMLPLGTTAPPFTLPDPSGRVWSLADFADAPALVVAFMCNHCPFVKHIRAGLAGFGRDAQARGVAVVGINANDVDAYPADAPPAMAAESAAAGYTFPYVHDATQAVAKAYRSSCTPDFYLFDGERRLVYRGQFDDSRPETKIPVTGASLRAAVEALLDDKPIPPEQKASLGCNIKWRAGNEPDYFG